MLSYNTLSDIDKKDMLGRIGAESIDELFDHIPDKLRFTKDLNIPEPHSEWALERKLRLISVKNETVDTMASFIGGGYYNHYIPSVVDAITQRGEYLTSYTPYQPEMSQGLLQALYEYQLIMAKWTGLPVVNSSCYDGSTALADAAWVTCVINAERGNKVAIAQTIWPQYKQVLKTYLSGRSVSCDYVDFDRQTGQLDVLKLEQMFKEQKPAGFLFQSPNALGVIEDVESIAKLCIKYGVISAISINPLLIGVMNPPGRLGIDIVTAEAQTLGGGLNAGGSSLGIFSTKNPIGNMYQVA